MVTMVQTVSTALDQSAMELMDHLMDMLEFHAPEKSQLLFHITTLTQLPEDHIKHPVISQLLTQLLILSQPMLLVHLQDSVKVVFHQWHPDQSE